MLITSFLIPSLSLKFTIILYLSRTWRFRHCWSKQYAGRLWHMNLVYGTARHESFVAQWLEHPTGVRKVIGSIPVWDSDFFLVPCLWHVDHAISHYCTSLCFYKETETLLLFPYADLWSLKNNNLCLIHVFLSPKSYYSQLNTVFVFRKLRNELASSYHAGECTKS